MDPQGLAIIEDEYVIVSVYDENHAEQVVDLPPFLEHIVGHENHILLLFESAQEKYRELPMIFHGDKVIKIRLRDEDNG